MSCCASDYFREPGCCDFTIKANVAWHPAVYLFSDDAGTEPTDLTGYTPLMQIRNLDTGALIMVVTTSYISAVDGQVQLSLTKAQTLTLGAQSPMPAMMYDLDFSSAAPDSFCAISGAIVVDRGYSQP